jgi:hypothetical protein
MTDMAGMAGKAEKAEKRKRWRGPSMQTVLTQVTQAGHRVESIMLKDGGMELKLAQPGPSESPAVNPWDEDLAKA